MVGVLLLVYVRLAHAGAVRCVSSDIIKTGFGVDSLGVKAGNKGGVAVRLDLFGCSVCVINAHLPAGHSHPEERNATYSEVLKGLATVYASARSGPHPPPLEHDLCVWLGDLNYRVEHPNEEVRRAIGRGEWQPLLRYDQLKIAQGSGAAFPDFVEAPIRFPPTYKYDVGTLSTYDTSEKARTPSWTDRVLWRPTSGSVSALSYVCTQSVVVSDHKPVSALLFWSPAAPADTTAEASALNGAAAAAQPPPAPVDLLLGVSALGVSAGPVDVSDAVGGAGGAPPLDLLGAVSAELLPARPTPHEEDMFASLDGLFSQSAQKAQGGGDGAYAAGGVVAGKAGGGAAGGIAEDPMALFPSSSNDFEPAVIAAPPAAFSGGGDLVGGAQPSTAALFPAGSDMFGGGSSSGAGHAGFAPMVPDAPPPALHAVVPTAPAAMGAAPPIDLASLYAIGERSGGGGAAVGSAPRLGPLGSGASPMGMGMGMGMGAMGTGGGFAGSIGMASPPGGITPTPPGVGAALGLPPMLPPSAVPAAARAPPTAPTPAAASTAADTAIAFDGLGISDLLVSEGHPGKKR